MRGSREEKTDSVSSGEDEESLRELKQAIQASSKGAKKTKNKSQLHELCTVNGIKFEKLQKGAGKNVASLEMFFSGFPKIIGMENFPDLQNLTLMGQQITTLENLDCLPNLTELCVSESKITGLEKLLHLLDLNLAGNRITEIGNSPNGNFNLKTLNLSANCMASLKMGVRKTGSINRDSGIEIPEALMPMIKKHNNRRAVRQRIAKGANQ